MTDNAPFYKILVNRGDWKGWAFWDDRQDVDHGEFSLDKAVDRRNKLQTEYKHYSFNILIMQELDV